jgi:hypothetical protein
VTTERKGGRYVRDKKTGALKRAGDQGTRVPGPDTKAEGAPTPDTPEKEG